MRRIRYQVAASLDGYIAGPKGEYDWIVMDPDIDFNALFDQFDTLLMGRHTYEMAQSGPGYKQRTVVISRTMKQADHPNITVINDNIADQLTALRAEPGKDIWLFGGGELFRSLLAIDQVDTVEPAIIPVVIGGGIPLLPAPAVQKRLSLSGHRIYPKSGIVLLTYDVVRAPQKKQRAAKVAKRDA